MSIFKSRYTYSQENERVMSQDEAIAEFMPQIMADGKDYAKFTEIQVRRAEPGELIETFTSDGKETQNTAGENDYVVKNLGGSGEEYILTEEKLNKRYFNVSGDIWKAKGECRALLYTGEPTSFMASWGEAMVLKPGDMICSPLPDLNEVYRIARAEFDSTYAPKQDTLKSSKKILHKLASIANELDTFGLTKEANTIDRILLKLSNDSTTNNVDLPEWFLERVQRFYKLADEGLFSSELLEYGNKIISELKNPGSFPEIVPLGSDPRRRMMDNLRSTILTALNERDEKRIQKIREDSLRKQEEKEKMPFVNTRIPEEELAQVYGEYSDDSPASQEMRQLIERLRRKDFYKDFGHVEQDEQRFKRRRPGWTPWE